MKNSLIKAGMPFQEYADVVLEHGDLAGGARGECSFQRRVRTKISGDAVEMLGDITITPAGCFVTRSDWTDANRKTEIIALASVQEGLGLIKKLMTAKGEKSSDFEGSAVKDWIDAFENGKHSQLLQKMAAKDSSDHAWGGLVNRRDAQCVFLTAIPSEIHAMVVAPDCQVPGVEKIGIAVNRVEAQKTKTAAAAPHVPQFMKKLLADSVADPSNTRPKMSM
jgi:hypothetical protein